jgi:U3 small nucleolar RNA-associated protein 5
VDRLGKRNNVKGGGGGASSQRGSSLVTWVKTVLVIHAGHLMTIPDLVTRLSGLHTTLTARLNLHDSLLSLSGRLDMVLSQIELRSSAAPTTLTSLAEKRDNANKKSSTITRYVEGESDSSNEEDTNVVVEIEHDNADAIEDVELDGSSEDDDDDDMSRESEDDDMHNSFIDDQAEEEYSDEENEDDSE